MGGHSLLFRVILFTLLVGIIDLYLWYRLGPNRSKLFIIRWFRKTIFPISLLFGLSFLGYLLLEGLPGLDPAAYRRAFIFTGAFQIIWMPRLVFACVDLIGLLPCLIPWRFRKQCSQITLFLGFFMWGLVLALCLYATGFAKSDFRIREMSVSVQGLPESMKGLRIAHFSDTHLGSFSKQENVRKGLKVLQSTHPDIIFFSGDLINTIAEEAWPYEADFAALSAAYGKYAILGNHDIGDYVKGDTIRPPEENRKLLRDFYQRTGFILLEDSADMIHIQGDSIIIAGVDNWGLPPFRQEGDLIKALAYFPGSPTLLLSHDPTHWDAEVFHYPQVLITFAGHTHGMQMGIYSKNRRWSPIQFKYPKWIGLYEKEGRYLHINPGFGFIGIPSRMGIYPEISILTLNTAPLP